MDDSQQVLTAQYPAYSFELDMMKVSYPFESFSLKIALTHTYFCSALWIKSLDPNL